MSSTVFSWTREMRSVSFTTLLLCSLLVRNSQGRASNSLSFRSKSLPLAAIEIDKPLKQSYKPPAQQQKRKDDRQKVLSQTPKLHDIVQEKISSETDDEESNRMPSLFTKPEENHLDKYAACLAATEGLRRGLMASTSKKESILSSSGKKGLWNGSKLFSSGDDKESETSKSESEKHTTAQYVRKSSQIVKMIGLTVPQFNQIGREIEQDAVLKEKVLEQAYLYRMAATVKMSKTPILIEDPTTSRLLQAHKRDRVAMFANAITEIETLRGSHLEKLKSQYGQDVAKLPDGVNLCDPGLLPLLSPRVRAVCEAFPHQAENIVRSYGLNSDEFNGMLNETKRNPIFRWRVRKYLEDGGNDKE